MSRCRILSDRDKTAEMINWSHRTHTDRMENGAGSDDHWVNLSLATSRGLCSNSHVSYLRSNGKEHWQQCTADIIGTYTARRTHISVYSHDSSIYNFIVTFTTIIWSLYIEHKKLREEKPKSSYDWRPVSQYVLMSSPFWFSWPDVCYCLAVSVVSLRGALSERTGLSIFSQYALFSRLSVHTYVFTYQMFNI
jgi:hypothetical protein